MTESSADSGLRFPDGFLFGVATAAYQIEGAVKEDGRGPSVWDTFSHTPGRTRDGDTGDVACDSYHRYPEDIRLMAELGVTGYRFSIAWPRIQPTGRGTPNPAGLDYYERLVDALLAADISPCPTLYHWDLPQGLEDDGGWQARDTAERFADYATQVANRLGDRVGRWITLNEPNVVTFAGYATGRHAPGLQLGNRCFGVAHHLMLGHGLAVRALRASTPDIPVGITLNVHPIHPASGAPADVSAAESYDAVRNGLFVDPVLRGRHPDQLTELFPATEFAAVHPGDLDTIRAPIDFLGINYYNPEMVRADPTALFGYAPAPWPDAARTAFDWPVVPDGLHDLMVRLRDRYGSALPPIHITENGSAWDDVVGSDGTVVDPDRVSYLDGHLRALRRAMDDGVDVRGYFGWSLLDNFEWAEGYSKRFGLVYVDYPTQQRIPKSSYRWYQALIAAHGKQ